MCLSPQRFCRIVFNLSVKRGVYNLLVVVKSVGLSGLDGYMVDVEVDISSGLPGFEIVGLPSTAVKEAKDRVRAAVRNCGLHFPIGRITVNLAPANLKKEGPVYDLPIAVGILAASGQITGEVYANYVYIGELSLDGSVKGVTGILPRVMVAADRHPLGIIVPWENRDEAALIGKADIYPVSGLKEIVGFCLGRSEIDKHEVNIQKLLDSANSEPLKDMADVKGNHKAKRALEIAAAGRHNILLVGPPGSGKTMLAHRVRHITPTLCLEEALETTKIYSVAGLLNEKNPLVLNRPFRSPHHSATKSGMVGGGRIPQPGEISLAHNGILFMDEFPEFNRDTLEALRQPLEDGQVVVSRVAGSIEFPARLMLVAAMNPCPCGFLGDSTRECTCTPFEISRYRNRISGPLLDRIDIHIEVPRISYGELKDSSIKIESSSLIRQRVVQARKKQALRFCGTSISANAQMGSNEIRSYCQVSGRSSKLMKEAFERLHLSVRAYNRILKVARTIADLSENEEIGPEHIAEAIQYRSFDRSYAH